MNSLLRLLLCTFLWCAAICAGPSSSSPSEQLGLIPLCFERNVGQMSRESPYIARLSGHTVLISPAHAEVVTPGANLRITFEGANTAAPISALEPMGGKVNYLIGADRSDWHGGVSTWGKVRVEQLYPGIDLIYHGEGRQFEYDFAVAPGSNSSIIKIRVEGSGQVRLNANGDAVLTTGSASITMRAPRLYQQISGERRQVEGAYHQDGSNLLSFIVGNY